MRLADRLSRGLERVDRQRRERHRTFILSQQLPDGGFRGREGDSDLYYTGFAVRGLTILGGLTPDECDRVGRYVQSHRHDRLNVIDLLSWLYSGLAVQLAGGADPFADAADDWLDGIASEVESLRRADGGYAKAAEGAAGSTYQSFLCALVYELMGRDVPQRDQLIRFLHDRQREDGGFVEIAPMKRSGTNPTAAAVALLQKFDALDDEIREDVLDFLSEVRSQEGGFQANTRIPFADGLSTFTGLLTAQNLGEDDLLPGSKVERFVETSLELPQGGCRAAAWDDQSDVEYTFYGIGLLGLLGSESG